MISLSFLTKEKVFNNDKLEVLKKVGVRAEITDLAILLGGEAHLYSFDKNKIYGSYWTSSTDKNNDIVTVLATGDEYAYSCKNTSIGGRPIICFNSEGKLKKEVSNIEYNDDGVLECEYGYYPQNIADFKEEQELEKAYGNQSLKITGRKYLIKSEDYTEYEFNNKRFIRMTADIDIEIASNKCKYMCGDVIWIKVEPVKWFVDKESNTVICKKIIFAGIPYTQNKICKFDKTNIYDFINGHLKIDLQGRNYGITKKYESRFNFDYRDVSEEEIIAGMVESNVAVFIHGKTGDGKSARVKQLDPECQIMYLRNTTIDGLIGKSVYNQSIGEIIDVKPNWLKKVEIKCNTEPNKLHILFLDELTNALPSIQSIAFNIILEKEVNGIWCLPENLRIIAAGNEEEESIYANRMDEPLFSRFAHVYINTTVDKWLKWAITDKSDEKLDYHFIEVEQKIHPLIYGFIAYKQSMGINVLRSEFNSKTPNTDPRKWEMASKVLYITNRPHMLRALIGKELTNDFIKFCKQELVDIKDIINKDAKIEDDKLLYSKTNKMPIELENIQKYRIAVELSICKENKNEDIEEFISKLGLDVLNIFNNLKEKHNKKEYNIKKENYNSNEGNLDIDLKDVKSTNLQLDWRTVLKEELSNQNDWTYRNAQLEDNVVRPQIEELYSKSLESEILIDTSKSMNITLIKEFVDECKNILKESKIKVGFFDTQFYGFQEVKNRADIDKLEITGGGGTDFDIAVKSFSKDAKNKIILTDGGVGGAIMPSGRNNVLWVVQGRKDILSKEWKVIYIYENK